MDNLNKKKEHLLNKSSLMAFSESLEEESGGCSENSESKQGFPVALWTNYLYNRLLDKRLLCLEACGSLLLHEVEEENLQPLHAYILHTVHL